MQRLPAPRRPTSRWDRRRGFTLVEVLAAMVFMAIVIPVVVEGLTIATRAGVATERRREAAELADQELTDQVVTGDWQNGNQQGDFMPDHPGFQWQLTTEAWDQDEMTVVTVETTYMVQGQQASVTLSTLTPSNTTSGDQNASSGTSSQLGLGTQ